MKSKIAVTVTVLATLAAAQASAQISFFENDDFQGRSFSTQAQVANFNRVGFNDRASSVQVIDQRWEVCDDAQFKGRCVVLRPGNYPSLRAMGMNDRISSVRALNWDDRIDERRYAPLPVAAAVSQVTFYENDGFNGKSFTSNQPVNDFQRFGFNDRASSADVVGGPWEVCENARFNGRCVVLRPGRYVSLSVMGLNDRISSVRLLNPDERIDERRYAPLPVAAVVSQVTFYENDGFRGQSFTSNQPINDFQRFGVNDRASSVEVVGGSWEVCEDARFNGRCVVLRPGRYSSLSTMGLNDRISSGRAVNQASTAVLAPDFRRRNNERLYEANVTSVRAVMGTPEQRCWVDREQVAQGGGGQANVPAAIAGALIGGILGHQVGGGVGKDLATAGGAVAGGMIGSNVGRDGAPAQPQLKDVKRCENLPTQAPPQYWDVSYNFRGQEHQVQLSAAPGQNGTANEQGEPRK